VPYTTASTGHVAVAQLRVGVSTLTLTLTADTRQRFGLADSDACPDCGDPDSVSHLLLDCLAYITGGALSRTLGEVFDQDALDIWSYPISRRRPGPSGPGLSWREERKMEHGLL